MHEQNGELNKTMSEEKLLPIKASWNSMTKSVSYTSAFQNYPCARYNPETGETFDEYGKPLDLGAMGYELVDGVAVPLSGSVGRVGKS